MRIIRYVGTFCAFLSLHLAIMHEGLCQSGSVQRDSVRAGVTPEQQQWLTRADRHERLARTDVALEVVHLHDGQRPPPDAEHEQVRIVKGCQPRQIVAVVRMRVDGVLRDMVPPAKRMQAAVINR